MVAGAHCNRSSSPGNIDRLYREFSSSALHLYPLLTVQLETSTLGPTKDSFSVFFKDRVYLFYKNHLYNYLIRRYVIRGCLSRATAGRILEIGCGISPMFDHGSRVIFTDLSWRALACLKKFLTNTNALGKRFTVCGATQLAFKESSFDSVICSEVLEHVEDDEGALKEIYRVLHAGGQLILTCPVRSEYLSFDDEFVGHYRRYDVQNLTERLSVIGFERFEIQGILGRWDKSIMKRVTRFLSVLRKGRRHSKQPNFVIQILIWVFLPLFLLFNYVIALCVYIQARTVPLKRTVCVLIRCQKSQEIR